MIMTTTTAAAAAAAAATPPKALALLPCRATSSCSPGLLLELERACNLPTSSLPGNVESCNSIGYGDVIAPHQFLKETVCKGSMVSKGQSAITNCAARSTYVHEVFFLLLLFLSLPDLLVLIPHAGEHYEFRSGESLSAHAANAFSFARIARILGDLRHLLHVFCPRAIAMDMEANMILNMGV